MLKFARPFLFCFTTFLITYKIFCKAGPFQHKARSIFFAAYYIISQNTCHSNAARRSDFAGLSELCQPFRPLFRPLLSSLPMCGHSSRYRTCRRSFSEDSTQAPRSFLPYTCRARACSSGYSSLKKPPFRRSIQVCLNTSPCPTKKTVRAAPRMVCTPQVLRRTCP